MPAIFFHPVLLASDTWWLPIVSKAFNLVVFIGILYYLLRKPVREFFTTRLVEVRTSEVGTTVSQEQIAQTPQVTRNFLSFADLAPGRPPAHGAAGARE